MMSLKNRGKEHTDMPDISNFIRRSRRSAKIAIAAPGTPDVFRRPTYKIARCVAGLRLLVIGGFQSLSFRLEIVPSVLSKKKKNK